MKRFNRFYHRLRGETKHTLVYECPCCEDRVAIDVWARKGETPEEALNRKMVRLIKLTIWGDRFRRLFGIKSKIGEL